MIDAKELLIKYSPFLKKNILPIALGLIGLIFLGYGLIALFGPSESASDVIFESGNEAVLSSASQIVVDVEGAVLKPGVYQVASDSRIKDALIAASGLSADADRDWVTKNLNLAAKLTDGAKIYIPSRGEVSLRETNPVGVISASGLININSASEQELDSLPGIGPVTAQKIINGRSYSSVDELLSKKIVGSKVFEEIKEKISVY